MGGVLYIVGEILIKSPRTISPLNDRFVRCHGSLYSNGSVHHHCTKGKLAWGETMHFYALVGAIKSYGTANRCG